MVLSRDAKDVLQKYGIGINSHWNAFRAPKGHYGTHSEDFIIHLGAALKRADRDIGTQAGVEELLDLGIVTVAAGGPEILEAGILRGGGGC